jgi:hypothetical protein
LALPKLSPGMGYLLRTLQLINQARLLFGQGAQNGQGRDMASNPG